MINCTSFDNHSWLPVIQYKVHEMTKDQTKTRCRELYLAWDGRHQDGPAKGMLFQAYMREQPDFASFTYGRASMHQVVQGWVDEWEQIFR